MVFPGSNNILSASLRSKSNHHLRKKKHDVEIIGFDAQSSTTTKKTYRENEGESMHKFELLSYYKKKLALKTVTSHCIMTNYVCKNSAFGWKKQIEKKKL